jgi:hypothetical protein
MSSGRKRRWWQFSLRTLLIGVFVVGPIVGFLGPPLVRSFLQWSPAAAAPNSAASPATPFNEYESDGYYESGETPLY